MKTFPLLLKTFNDSGCRLDRIEAKTGDAKSESWLQELLYLHPELLPVDAFGDLYSPVIPLGREIGTRRGPIDNLYVSPSGRITIVETKLWKNPEKHRTVVAQIIDYAKELATWDYDQLCEAVETSSKNSGEQGSVSLEQKISDSLLQAKISLHEFQENVAECLSNGTFFF